MLGSAPPPCFKGPSCLCCIARADEEVRHVQECEGRSRLPSCGQGAGTSGPLAHQGRSSTSAAAKWQPDHLVDGQRSPARPWQRKTSWPRSWVLLPASNGADGTQRPKSRGRRYRRAKHLPSPLEAIEEGGEGRGGRWKQRGGRGEGEGSHRFPCTARLPPGCCLPRRGT